MSHNAIIGLVSLYFVAASITGMTIAVEIDRTTLPRSLGAVALAIAGMMLLWPLTWLIWAYRALRS